MTHAASSPSPATGARRARNPAGDGRRTDTRRRIHDIALAVFSEVGYERGTLQQIAERLDITRAALYYHYRSKEEILGAIHDELALPVDAVVDWSRSQPPGPEVRHETLRRLNGLASGPWGAFHRFAEDSRAAIRHLATAQEYRRRMDAIGDLLAPSADTVGCLRGRLALSALLMTSDRGEQPGRAGDQEGSDAALAVALELTR